MPKVCCVNAILWFNVEVPENSNIPTKYSFSDHGIAHEAKHEFLDEYDVPLWGMASFF